MKKAKLIVIVILALIGVIIVLQNTESVDTKILFATIIMPRAILLLVAIAIGFVLGILVSIMSQKKRSKAG